MAQVPFCSLVIIYYLGTYLKIETSILNIVDIDEKEILNS